MQTQTLPTLYSLQNCQYAIRARFAIFKAQQRILIRAVKLNNKPPEMLQASAKGSVPILVISPHRIIDESLEIMLWALTEHDPDDLLLTEQQGAQQNMQDQIKKFEREFIPALENYCCAKRYHEDNLNVCRDRCEAILQQLEMRLTKNAFLFGKKESLLDIALFPFIRKFARVERQWYRQSPYPNLRNWLDSYLHSPIFTKVMTKYELWLENRIESPFPL